MCGEKFFGFSDTQSGKGSPPRVRGKAEVCTEHSAVSGITPACAGKSGPNAQKDCFHRDHPRVCGEKLITGKALCYLAGSPPRVRGKVAREMSGQGSFGITPACAGKSTGKHSSPIIARDHPRVCGEKLHCRLGSGCFLGSPPRVRGKDHELLYGLAGMGITPACAGKSHN